ncbi:MAG: ribonuclease HI [Planctomycetota bacterium]|nr:MAG: ribonuclease HI [Planctomycetota bacterium]REK12599.1 MAG: ribonuclease HI [Planctomycetota bacterium]REK31572.1 MAG: ribonuclease HI [Planctomycetota bacterium]REK40558.1 MAG: ribonuclease HI [Planctomycetota bacterium]
MSATEQDVEVRLYTDGACSGNPGPGGWAFILEHLATGQRKEVSGGEPETTNNRMELMAVIEGLGALKRPTAVCLVSDSQYVGKGLTEWMPNWKRNNWKRGPAGARKPVKNVDLWQQLDELIARHTLTYEWVAGHAGHEENERCDELAVAAYQQYL